MALGSRMCMKINFDGEFSKDFTLTLTLALPLRGRELECSLFS